MANVSSTVSGVEFTTSVGPPGSGGLTGRHALPIDGAIDVGGFSGTDGVTTKSGYGGYSVCPCFPFTRFSCFGLESRFWC